MHGGLSDPNALRYQEVINNICNLDWTHLGEHDLVNIAWVYYYFSIQFRENLEIARKIAPDDPRLEQLDREERDTANLSPWPGVAAEGERMNHDEFMRRTIELAPLPNDKRSRLESIGQRYLAAVRSLDEMSRALSIASYEDGGLESVFRSILKAPRWHGPVLQAFRHFLAEHVRFDSDPEQGHGALCRHLKPDDRVLPLWRAFEEILVEAAPQLAHSAKATA